MSALTPNPFLDPSKGVTVFGKVVQRLRNLLSPTTEEPPLQTTFGTDAEARGWGSSPYQPDIQSLSSWAFDKMRIEAGRFAAYRDYELMDGEYPEVSSALDIIAEFATQNDDPQSTTFTIKCDDDEDLAAHLLQRSKDLQLDRDVTGLAREVAKYGTTFVELCANEDGQLDRVKPLPPTTMIRNEDRYGRLLPEAFTQMDPKTQQAVAHFSAWQVVQGRYMRQFGRMYGSSILEPARRVYKQLSLIEDGMVVGRLYRSHLRLLWQIPVDGMSPDQADLFLKQKKQDMRKKSRFNPAAGKPEMFDSPINADDDFFVGVRKEGVNSDVKTIQGQGGLDQIGDVEYFQQKLFAALKVPKGLLNFEKDINAKATLLVQDLNFARMLRRIQQIVARLITEILERDLILQGVDVTQLPEWTVEMPEVSTKDEQLSWQVEALKANVALTYGQKLPIVDKLYIYKSIMKLTQDEIDRLMDLDPEEIGVQTMPSPPFENVDANVELGGGIAGPGGSGGPAGTFGTEQFISLDIMKAGDKQIVRRIREILDLPLEDPIEAGELKVAAILRSLREEYGDFEIALDGFVSDYKAARNGVHA